jgi:hypothetical protein
MYIYTRTNVLLPEWILEKKLTASEHEFSSIIKNYLLRYQNYQFICFEYPFAVCDRIDDVKERRKKRE